MDVLTHDVRIKATIDLYREMSGDRRASDEALATEAVSIARQRDYAMITPSLWNDGGFQRWLYEPPLHNQGREKAFEQRAGSWSTLTPVQPSPPPVLTCSRMRTSSPATSRGRASPHATPRKDSATTGRVLQSAPLPMTFAQPFHRVTFAGDDEATAMPGEVDPLTRVSQSRGAIAVERRSPYSERLSSASAVQSTPLLRSEAANVAVESHRAVYDFGGACPLCMQRLPGTPHRSIYPPRGSPSPASCSVLRLAPEQPLDANGIANVFDRLSENGNGRLNRDHVNCALHICGFDTASGPAKRVLDEYRSSHAVSGVLDRGEFAELVRRLQNAHQDLGAQRSIDQAAADEAVMRASQADAARLAAEAEADRLAKEIAARRAQYADTAWSAERAAQHARRHNMIGLEEARAATSRAAAALQQAGADSEEARRRRSQWGASAAEQLAAAAAKDAEWNAMQESLRDSEAWLRSAEKAGNLVNDMRDSNRDRVARADLEAAQRNGWTQPARESRGRGASRDPAARAAMSRDATWRAAAARKQQAQRAAQTDTQRRENERSSWLPPPPHLQAESVVHAPYTPDAVAVDPVALLASPDARTRHEPTRSPPAVGLSPLPVNAATPSVDVIASAQEKPLAAVEPEVPAHHVEASGSPVAVEALSGLESARRSEDVAGALPPDERSHNNFEAQGEVADVAPGSGAVDVVAGLGRDPAEHLSADLPPGYEQAAAKGSVAAVSGGEAAAPDGDVAVPDDEHADAKAADSLAAAVASDEALAADEDAPPSGRKHAKGEDAKESEEPRVLHGFALGGESQSGGGMNVTVRMMLFPDEAPTKAPPGAIPGPRAAAVWHEPLQQKVEQRGYDWVA